VNWIVGANKVPFVQKEDADKDDFEKCQQEKSFQIESFSKSNLPQQLLQLVLPKRQLPLQSHYKTSPVLII